MFENPRRGRQARNFTTNVPKILDLKLSSEQIFFRKLSLGAPDTIADDALKVIKTFSYAEGENSTDWRVVMAKMEKHCIDEVNEICERYCFNMRDKLPTESVDSFVA